MVGSTCAAVGDPPTVERRFRAMSTEVHVVVTTRPGGEAGSSAASLLELAEGAVRAREARWSRFLADSELSRLNACPGRPVIVSPDTFSLISAAIDAYHLTEGAFDPTVGSSLVAAGYDRSFELIPADGPARRVAAPSPLGIELHRATSAIVVPPGVLLDLGGIAKGATSEAVAGELLRAGAAGCCVNIGGDLRVAGAPPDDGGWTVTLDCPGSDDIRMVALRSGAVCTSTTTKRRWSSSDGPQHHLRDPATGSPLDTDIVSASVIAARADQAEVLTKAALAAGAAGGREAIESQGATGLLVERSGAVIELAGFDRFAIGGRR